MAAAQMQSEGRLVKVNDIYDPGGSDNSRFHSGANPGKSNLPMDEWEKQDHTSFGNRFIEDSPPKLSGEDSRVPVARTYGDLGALDEAIENHNGSLRIPAKAYNRTKPASEFITDKDAKDLGVERKVLPDGGVILRKKTDSNIPTS